MPLFEEHRPKSFDEIVGQDEAIAKIKKILGRKNFVSGAILITGPSGSGKTTLANCIATHLQCCKFDGVHSIESRSCTLATLKDIEERMWLMTQSPDRPWKAYIIDEAQDMIPAGQSYLLGLLERLPRNRIVIATSTEPKPFNDPLMSRWAKIATNQLSVEDCTSRLRMIAEKIGEPIEATDVMLRTAISRRGGNLRLCITDIIESGDLM